MMNTREEKEYEYECDRKKTLDPQAHMMKYLFVANLDELANGISLKEDDHFVKLIRLMPRKNTEITINQ